jgi:hypothetical protein
MKTPKGKNSFPQTFTNERPPGPIEPMRRLPTRTGLPRLDRASWEKGFADGFHGQVWWPGPGTEPLSYSSGYTEAQAEPDPNAEFEAIASVAAPLGR